MKQTLMSKLIKVAFVVIALTLILNVYTAFTEKRDWDSFFKTHNCTLTGTTSSTTGLVGGKWLYIPGKNTYNCEGVIVERQK